MNRTSSLYRLKSRQDITERPTDIVILLYFYPSFTSTRVQALMSLLVLPVPPSQFMIQPYGPWIICTVNNSAFCLLLSVSLPGWLPVQRFYRQWPHVCHSCCCQVHAGKDFDQQSPNHWWYDTHTHIMSTYHVTVSHSVHIISSQHHGATCLSVYEYITVFYNCRDQFLTSSITFSKLFT